MGNDHATRPRTEAASGCPDSDGASSTSCATGCDAPRPPSRQGVSVDAVKYHLANISGKLGVSVYTDDDTGAEEWMTFFADGEGNTLALMSRVAPAT